MTANPSEIARLRGEAARTQLLSIAAAQVWNIAGDGLSAVSAHVAGPLSFWWDDDEDDDELSDNPGYEVTPEGVAIIPIAGTLVNSEPTWWMSYLGYCSLPAIARAVRAAADNPSVESLLLAVDSPGGQVAGLATVCEAVWDVRQAGEKPIWAACEFVCSAAYEIVSQCERVYLTADGLGGCLGTIILMSDWSGYYSQMGVVKLRITSDGGEAYKGEGAMGTEITAAQQADFKRICNEYRGLFNPILQRGRGFSDAEIKTLVDGRSHVGANVLALNLVDGIASPEDVLAALAAGADPDDVAMPPSAAPPDLGIDDDPTDFNHGREADDAAERAEKKGSIMLNKSASHPALLAALALGLDTADKINDLFSGQSALKSENERLSRENKEFKDAASAALAASLAQAKESAKSAAVTAFGAGSAELKEAESLIDAQTAPSALSAMAAAYRAAAPRGLRPGGTRQTRSSMASANDDPDDSAAKAVADGLDPEKIYARRNAGK